MCHAVATAAPAVHCNGIQPYRGAACQEGRLLLLSSRRVINYLALWYALTDYQYVICPVRAKQCKYKTIRSKGYPNKASSASMERIALLHMHAT